MRELGAYKQQYRAALDSLPLSSTERQQVIAEAVAAFELNGAITRALSAPTFIA